MKNIVLCCGFIGISLFSYCQVPKFKNATLDNLPEISQSGRNSMDAKVGDIDGDGDLDIVVAVEYLKTIFF